MTKCLYPVTWGSDNQFSSADTGYNTSSVIIPDISVFGDNDDVGDINVIGTKGRLERLKVSGISPWWEHQKLDSTNNMTWKVGYGTSGITSTDGSFTYLSNSNNITGTVGGVTLTHFTDGVGGIQVTGTVTDGHTFTIITPDGRQVTYEFDLSGSVANGALMGGAGSNTCIEVQHENGNATDVATRIREAIENVSNGHGERIDFSVSLGAIMTLTYTQPTMDEVLFEGSYFAKSPIKVIEALMKLFIKKGGKFKKERVKSIKKTETNQINIKTNSGETLYDRVVITSGVWSNNLLKHIGDKVPLEAERGYHLVNPELKNIVKRPISWQERGTYFTPMSDGLRTGGIVEFGALNETKNERVLNFLNRA